MGGQREGPVDLVGPGGKSLERGRRRSELRPYSHRGRAGGPPHPAAVGWCRPANFIAGTLVETGGSRRVVQSAIPVSRTTANLPNVSTDTDLLIGYKSRLVDVVRVTTTHRTDGAVPRR